jgi:hypothetical protein
VVVERGAIDVGQSRDVVNGDLLEALLLHQVAQGSLEGLSGPSDSWVAYFAVRDRHRSCPGLVTFSSLEATREKKNRGNNECRLFRRPTLVV